MNQYLAILPDGSIVGVLLDSSPLMSADEIERWWHCGTGIRRPADAARAAEALGAVLVVELVHRPARVSRSGRLRHYPSQTYCRVVHTAH